jgi:hypothetical protein
MTATCDCLVSRRDIVGIDEWSAQGDELWTCRCLRPDGHVGFHLIKQIDRIGGKYVLWQPDLCEWGTCEDCDSDDDEAACILYAVVSPEVAQRLIKDGSLEG